MHDIFADLHNRFDERGLANAFGFSVYPIWIGSSETYLNRQQSIF
jgi:hypothetical protein